MLRSHFFSHVAQTSPGPLALEISSAKGCYLLDNQGVKHLDLISGISVSVLGHRHPAVERAVIRQVKKYWHTLVYGEYVLAPQVKLARLLAKNLPKNLSNVYFTNSGTEAVEGAMKLAKRYTGRAEILACRFAYHGSTQGAASLMNPTDFIDAFRPLLPAIGHIDFNCDFCIEKITEKTAAVIIETVQGEIGVRLPNLLFLQKLREKCTKTGALLIFDEIQAGMGRTGTLWAFSQYDVVPDVLLLAKGFGGGLPLGAFISSKKIMTSLSHDPVLGHITTFGGHPVSCAAGLATLEILTKTDLISTVKSKEARFHELLKHQHIKEIRSAGLLMAIDLDDAERVQRVIQFCLKNGVITDWFLFNDRSLRLAPPLIISDFEIEFACRVILEGLEKS
jgi:acetylornithine/succinyldiaminopimelate/putrescine aminotransferase